jgi:hypothetical protein
MLSHMRTTIDISDELFRKAKRRAADDGVPLRDVVEAALRGYLTGRPRTTGYRLRWTPDRGEMLPGVDLDDRSSLHDIMDGVR